MTDMILQEARTEAKAQLFGIAEDNVKYSEGMKSELEKDGHIVKLMYTSRKEIYAILRDGTRFLHGVFFMPSFSQKVVPEPQTLFTADACHLNFGKHTMFMCYGITANANMSPVGFAIIFGNENGASWKEFWCFIVWTHPSINRAEV